MRSMLKGMLFVAMVAPACALAAGSDELWEMTMRGEMAGMSMPPIKNTSCMPKGETKPYAPEDDGQQNCQVTDMRMQGNTMRWKIRCTGKDPMEGSGEMTRTADTLKGVTKLKMRDGEITQYLSGKRVGTCDAAAEKKQREAEASRMQEKMTEQSCRNMVEGVMSWIEMPPDKSAAKKMKADFSPNGFCVAHKPQLCKKAQDAVGTYEGYSAFARNSKTWVIDACGINLQAKREQLCRKAVSERKLKFVAVNCPAETKSLGDKYCKNWGRDYTSDSENEYAPICRKLHGETVNDDESGNGNESDQGESDGDQEGIMGKLFGGSKDSQPAKKTEPSGSSDNPAGAVLDGAKKLKGLFGF